MADEDYDTDSTARSSSEKKKKKRKKKRRPVPSNVPPHGEPQAVAIDMAIAPSPAEPPATLFQTTANLCLLLAIVLGVLNVVLVSAALYAIADVRRAVSELSTTCAAGYCACDNSAPTPSPAKWTADDGGGAFI